MRFEEIRKSSDAMNETKDCTVIAVSVVCGIPYEEAHALLAKAGRKPRKGTSVVLYHNVIRRQVKHAGVLTGVRVFTEDDPNGWYPEYMDIQLIPKGE